MTHTLKTAFVAGATGLTGRHLVQVLRDQGVETHAHVRPDSRSLERWKSHFSSIGATCDTTPWEDEAMRETLERVRPDAVFALLGTTRKRQRGDHALAQAASYETVDYGLSALLLRASGALSTKPRFVYLSSLGATLKTKNPYLIARGKMEQALRESPLEWIAARPSIIVGDRDDKRPMESLAKVVLDGALGLGRFLGGAKLADRYHSLQGDKLARALLWCATECAPNRVVSCEELRAHSLLS